MPTKNFPLRIRYYDRKTTGLLTTGLLKTEFWTTGGLIDNWSF